MSSWGTASFLLDAGVIQQIKVAIEAQKRGEVIPVIIPPGLTASYSEIDGYGQKVRQLVITSGAEIDHNTIVSIASCFGFYGAPQRWSMMHSKHATTYEVVVIQAHV